MSDAETKPVPVYFDSALFVNFHVTDFDRIYSNHRHVLAAARSFGLHGIDPIVRERRR
jgi:hypothetical protein